MSAAGGSTTGKLDEIRATAAGASDAGTPTSPPASQESQSHESSVGGTHVAGAGQVSRGTSSVNTVLDLPPVPAIPPTYNNLITSGGRNQAPGILDRRKSTKSIKATKTRGALSPQRSTPPPTITFSMADAGAEMRVRDEDITPGQESEGFESASESTPKIVSPAPPAEATGLAINGTEEKAQSTVEGAARSNGEEPKVAHSRQTTIDITPGLGAPLSATQSRERSISPSKRPTQVMQGLSGDFAVNAPPPPSTADRVHALEARQNGDGLNGTSPRPTEGFARKASNGLSGLLGRMGSIRRPARSPPARTESKFRPERANTSSSMASLNGSMNGLASIADVPDGTSPKPSLQDQFADLRRQEENTMNGVNGHATDDVAPQSPRKHSDAGILSKVSEEGSMTVPTRLERAASHPGPLKSPPLDPSLPPGTATGMTAGPADEPRPVNWDLWQSVVYEGPAAVRRTSGEELQLAIASGIPPAIRGVVWQVLAESKNEDLEAVYRTLKARGTDAEQQSFRPVPASRTESLSNLGNGVALDKESVASSRSSTHSNESTPATSAMASPPMSVEGNPMDTQGKILAEKQKRESAALTKLEKAIKRDMGSRTSFSKYTQSAGLQDGLFGVCKAYALFDEGVGYAQGINFIAMPLLFNLSEEESFTLLVKLMSKYDLRSMFTPDMNGLHLRLYQFERLLEDLEPALYCHLRRRKVDPQLYATQWFLTLFAYRFPLQLVLRVYDLIFSDGLIAILKFGIVLMQRNREALLAMKDMSQLSAFLKEKIFDVYIDKSPSASSLLDSGFFGSVTGGADKELYRADEMVRDACEVDITEAQLAQYTSEWEEQQKNDRERVEELESLRTSSTTMTTRVKALEDRTQQQDTEHVSMAGELVRAKVQLDEVLDENEGLKMKVEELQKMVETQPAEVEEKLKEEMERIMARNLEVQNENRMLHEEQEDMERELVGAKMALAQAQSDRDEVQQRFANVQALING